MTDFTSGLVGVSTSYRKRLRIRLTNYIWRLCRSCSVQAENLLRGPNLPALGFHSAPPPGRESPVSISGWVRDLSVR